MSDEVDRETQQRERQQQHKRMMIEREKDADKKVNYQKPYG